MGYLPYTAATWTLPAEFTDVFSMLENVLSSTAFLMATLPSLDDNILRHCVARSSSFPIPISVLTDPATAATSRPPRCLPCFLASATRASP